MQDSGTNLSLFSARQEPPGLEVASQIPLACGFQVSDPFTPRRDALSPSASSAASSSPGPEEEEVVVQGKLALVSLCLLALQLLPPAHALTSVPAGAKLMGW